jgi:hypothetical protein
MASLLSVRYIFVRAKRRFREDETSLAPLLAELDSPIRMLALNNELTWSNGAVIQFYSDKTAREISAQLMDHLAQFDMWSIHDTIGDYSEPFGGLLEMYYREVQSPESESNQIFLKYKYDTIDHDDVMREVLGAIKEPARRVFHFQGGCVLMLQARQPIGVLARRFEGKSLRRYIQCVAVTGGRDSLAIPASISVWRKLS